MLGLLPSVGFGQQLIQCAPRRDRKTGPIDRRQRQDPALPQLPAPREAHQTDHDRRDEPGDIVVRYSGVTGPAANSSVTPLERASSSTAN